ncbi:MAG: hypothetical protein K6G30_13540 [Acetatifactor sp.]|nr:hypothetical protein [Acetatifactor sp.]
MEMVLNSGFTQLSTMELEKIDGVSIGRVLALDLLLQVLHVSPLHVLLPLHL